MPFFNIVTDYQNYQKTHRELKEKQKQAEINEQYQQDMNNVASKYEGLLNSFNKYIGITESVCIAKASLYSSDLSHNLREFDGGYYNQVNLHVVNKHFIIDSYRYSETSNILHLLNIYDYQSKNTSNRVAMNKNLKYQLALFNKILANKKLRLEYDVIDDLCVYISPIN